MQFSSSSYSSISKTHPELSIPPFEPAPNSFFSSFRTFSTSFSSMAVDTPKKEEAYPGVQQFLLIFPIAVALISFIVYLLWTPSDKGTEGKIGLPVRDGEAMNGHHEEDDEDEEDEKKDPFEINDDELAIDGYPVNEGSFWKKVAFSKAALLITIIPPVAANAFNLVYFLLNRSYFEQLSQDPVDPFTFPANYILETICALIPVHALILGLGVYYQTLNGDVRKHWATTIHLSTVMFFTEFCQILMVLLPSSYGGGDVFSPIPSQPRELRTIQLLSALQPLLLAIPFVIAMGIPRGPALYFPIDKILTPRAINQLKEATADSPVLPDVLNPSIPNVTEEVSNSVWGALVFSYSSTIIWKGYKHKEGLDAWDLPVVTPDLRTLSMYKLMSRIYGETQKKRKRSKRAMKKESFVDRLPMGWSLLYKVFKANKGLFGIQCVLASTTAFAYYLPAFFLNRFVGYLEDHPDRSEIRWGWLWSFALFSSNMVMYLAVGMMWSIASTLLQSRIKLQLNTILFRKTLVKKDLAATTKEETKEVAGENVAPALPEEVAGAKDEDAKLPVVVPAEASKGKADEKVEEDDEDVSSKSQIMTLFTVDVDRIADFVFHTFTLVDAPIEIVFATWFLYKLLGPSALYGLLAAIVTLPINHFASKIVVANQDDLMNARDKRVALMNEMLGAIRMVKFMAWERSFEKRVNAIREEELRFLHRNYIIETLFTFIYTLTPIIVTLTAFLHYVLVEKKPLTPSIAFTSVSVFNELRFALSALPETFIQTLQGFVSLRRIEKYMSTAEITPGQGADTDLVAFNSATITWPRDVAPAAASGSASAAASAAPTPKAGFVLSDITLNFPQNKLSLICGKLGAGKTLLLLGLLGEADVLAGQVLCPRSVPNAMDDYGASIAPEDWIVDGVTAYAPQVAWLQNASIRDNILFGAPYDVARYKAVLEACSLVSDLKILEDGDETEVGEKGLNLSGGQKARVSLARAVYSRAKLILLDDILSAVDAHTSAAIMQNCFQGDLLKNRTCILVSHHIQLVSPAASYIVALENGDLKFAGDRDAFIAAGMMEALEEEPEAEKPQESEQDIIDKKAVNKRLNLGEKSEPNSETSSIADTDDTVVPSSPVEEEKKKPRKLVEDEKSATGNISAAVWAWYFKSQGGAIYWTIFCVCAVLGALPPLIENGWLRAWSSSYEDPENTKSPAFYVLMYALITIVGALAVSLRFFVLYSGSISASKAMHKSMLIRVLLATIRFHDTSSRGRVLNRFGKDIERLDSDTADNFGRTLFYMFNIIVTFSSITFIGGWPFAVAAVCLFVLYFYYGRVYGATSRDLRRLDSTTRSPLYAMYSEVISGIQVIRAFGASTSNMRMMFNIADTNTSSFIWFWTANRWVSTRFNILSSIVVGLTAIVMLVAGVPAAAAGFALAFANTCSGDLLFVARRYVALEQSMVAVERLKEYTELPLEAPEHIEPRPPASWPHKGEIEVKDLVIRYAPDLPNVLHNISFKVNAKEKIGIVGATGCGKSTLALSLFRFVEPTEGTISIDGLDITKVGLTDLRSRVVIIPQDPTILSGTVRSTLDVFEEYDDADIFESLRRVHLLKSDEAENAAEADSDKNKNVFRNLESPVSEGGDNFSQGQKQLICMARAILRRPKILVQDESTASVDYETDELISQTIREEFSEATILTIAHRLKTIIDYDRVLVLDKGVISEFDSPANLLRNHSSKFYSLCKATGTAEFKTLRFMANEKERKDKGESEVKA